MNTHLYRGIADYIAQVRRFNLNIRLIFVASALGHVGQGIFHRLPLRLP